MLYYWMAFSMDQSAGGVAVVASLFGEGRFIWIPFTPWRPENKVVI
jgi:hypothetical protein